MEGKVRAWCLSGVLVAAMMTAGNFAALATACTSTFLLDFGLEPGRLSAPLDVATDSAGNVWVADTDNDRLQKFDSSGEFVTRFEVKPVGGKSLGGIATDSGGNVWVVVDTKVRKYKANGELLLEFGSEGSGNGQFMNARDLAIDGSNNIWVVDSGEAGSAVRVQKFNSSGTYLSQFGKEGAGNGEFKSPEAITVDS
jgi:tripartite motif-containing protein 71